MNETMSSVAPPRVECERAAVATLAAMPSMGDRQRVGNVMADVSGVVLAGTHPWGGCDLELVVPRALVPLANRPLLTHVLSWLGDGGVERATVCGNRYTDPVRCRLMSADGGGVTAGLDVHYYEDMAPRGPAGCVRDAGMVSDATTLVVVDGSLVPQVALESLVETHRRTEADVTVVVSRDARGNGVNGDGLSPVGVYVFERRVIDHIPHQGYQDIKEGLIPLLYRKGMAILPFQANGSVPRVTNVDSYLAVNAWLLRSMWRDRRGGAGFGGEGYRTVGDAGVHRESSIDSTARLSGPILIDKGARIGRGVTIIGPTSVGEDCRIADGAVICRSVVWDHCSIGAKAVLDRCILTSGSCVSENTAFRYVVFSEQKKHEGGHKRLSALGPGSWGPTGGLKGNAAPLSSGIARNGRATSRLAAER